MREKKKIYDSNSENINSLQVVRQREQELDQTLAQTRAQADALRRQGEQRAAAIRVENQQRIDTLEQETRAKVAISVKALEDQAAEELAERVAQIAHLAEANMEKTVQFLLREVLPKA